MAAKDRGVGASLETVFGIDPRGLATWRIGAGLLLLVDLGQRAVDLTAHYTDGGVLPRTLLDPSYREPLFAFHLWGGSAYHEASLFLVAGLFALLMMLGLWTRPATLISWALLASLQLRNPHVNNYGDEIVRILLFWSIFLPLGRCWSLDALRARAPSPGRVPVLSVATAAILLQIGAIYFVGALLKTGPDWREHATAIYYAVSQDWVARPTAIFLRRFPELMEWMTRATLLLEYVGPFFLLFPSGRAGLRTAAVLVFCSFHASLALSLVLGIFPFFMFAALTLFLPPRFWDSLVSTSAFGRAASWIGSGSRRLVRRLPAARRFHPPIRRAGLFLTQTVAALLLLYAAADNVARVRGRPLPPAAERTGQLLRIRQNWIMYAPNGPRRDGWYVMPGHLAGGRTVDLVNGESAPSWDKPPLVAATAGNPRWTNYLINLQSPRWETHRYRYADWRCRQWNRQRTGADRLDRLEIWFVDETTPTAYEMPRRQRRLLLDRPCPTP